MAKGVKKSGPPGEYHHVHNIEQHYIDRFHSRCEEQPNGCIFLMGNVQNNGYKNWWYKHDSVDGRRLRYITAHRFSALISGKFKEADVNELCVLHDCDQHYDNNDISYRQCVNPAHLFLGTVKDNIQDCINKGRYVKPPSYIGADNYNAKLTEKQALWVIDQHHKITQQKLAEILNVGTSTIEAIHMSRTWKHLPR